MNTLQDRLLFVDTSAGILSMTSNPKLRFSAFIRRQFLHRVATLAIVGPVLLASGCGDDQLQAQDSTTGCLTHTGTASAMPSATGVPTSAEQGPGPAACDQLPGMSSCSLCLKGTCCDALRECYEDASGCGCYAQCNSEARGGIASSDAIGCIMLRGCKMPDLNLLGQVMSCGRKCAQSGSCKLAEIPKTETGTTTAGEAGTTTTTGGETSSTKDSTGTTTSSTQEDSSQSTSSTDSTSKDAGSSTQDDSSQSTSSAETNTESSQDTGSSTESTSTGETTETTTTDENSETTTTAESSTASSGEASSTQTSTESTTQDNATSEESSTTETSSTSSAELTTQDTNTAATEGATTDSSSTNDAPNSAAWIRRLLFDLLRASQ